MSDSSGAAQRTSQARELFFNQGVEPDAWVAPYISRSWARSRGCGVAGEGIAPVGESLLRERREASRLLLASAQPELDALAEHAVGNGCVVIVTDRSGLILDEIGSPDFLPTAQRVALLPGVEWSEQRCGTNAIGTVLVEGHPLAVLGGEHFLAGHGSIGCAAAPIYTGRGEIAGVLDVSGDAVRVDGHTLGLVRMASQQIEHRMMLAHGGEGGEGGGGGDGGEWVRFHPNAALLGSSREGLLRVVDGHVVAANRVALGCLAQHWRSVLDRPVDELLGAGWRQARSRAASVQLPGGQQVVLCRQGAATRPRVQHKVSVAMEARPREGDQDAGLDVALQTATKVLDAGVAVLITGETGVGKEVFARRLHAASRRRNGPLVIVNCAALPEGLIEAELFGYEDGAFTGARRQGAAGRIREAEGGILMLDEIGDMPLHLQTRLLRVLEDRLVTPLGIGRPVRVDFQLVCATHRDLQAMADAGAFRADLMFRVKGYEVRLPSLRERQDRSALVRRLFAELGGAARQLRLHEDAVAELAGRPWPGNIRELVAALRTLIALAVPGETVGPGSLAQACPAPAGPRDAEDTSRPLADQAQQAIRHALREAGGNVSVAARRLGLHRSTLYRHLKQHPQ